MPDPIDQPEDVSSNGAERPTRVPPGAPAWVTDELIQDTLDTFQSHYEKTLLPEDALEILVNVTNLLLFLQE